MVAYTLVGGLKATILTDWVHTFILLIIIILFSLTAYATSNELGSPGAVYDLLVKAAEAHPVDGNQDGSYLTMRSQEGAIFFVINMCVVSCSLPWGRKHVLTLEKRGQLWHRVPRQRLL